MRFDILALFPELISGYFEDSIIKRAREKGLISISLHQLRDFATGKHRQVDDTPYGGGSGMILRADVLASGVEHISQLSSDEAKVIYLSPQGEKLDNSIAKEFALEKHIILVCGRYEGVDQRFIDMYVDREVSIGDYVLSGGELPAAVFVDVVSRFVPGVVGKGDCVTGDTFENSRLKHPQYTRPREFKGHKVPEVLLSGNHEDIDRWRDEHSLKVTKTKRKDLL